ncbi:hypothetical protein [Flavobacterium sp.]|uniref:hypothetical protein n=1 Tax=Flavobacterium sp. TaxID=239 RepID=UPI002FDAE3A8
MKKLARFIDEKQTYITMAFILILFLIVPILVYSSHFYEKDLSKSLSDWANFSVYFGLFVSIANLFVFIILTFKINEFNDRNNSKNQQLQISLNRPVISFRRNEGNSEYQIENIGNAVALNVKLKLSTNKQGNWNVGYILHSFKKDYNRTIIDKPLNSICATYDDVFGNTYYSYMKGDYLTIIEASKLDEKNQLHKKLLEDVNNYKIMTG